jgi:Kef-type K+ transport system membrane component KefB
MLSILVTRFFTTFGLAFILKMIKKSYEFSFRQLAILWVGGLFRGSIAFALILSISTHHKDMIRATILYIIICSMIAYTLILPFWYRWMSPLEYYERHQSIIEALADGYYRNSYMITGKENYEKIQLYNTRRNWFHSKWRDLDNKYLKPCLINPKALQKLQENKKKLEDENHDLFKPKEPKNPGEETELSDANLILK